MTFLELAHAIDEAKADVARAETGLAEVEGAVIALKEKHHGELVAAEETVLLATRDHAKVSQALQALFRSMHEMMGTTVAPPKTTASASELKQLAMDGIKFRSKLGG